MGGRDELICGLRLLCFNSDRDPERWLATEFNVDETSLRHHLMDFGLGKSLFEFGAEAVKRVCSHKIQALVPVVG